MVIVINGYFINPFIIINLNKGYRHPLVSPAGHRELVGFAREFLGPGGSDAPAALRVAGRGDAAAGAALLPGAG